MRRRRPAAIARGARRVLTVSRVGTQSCGPVMAHQTRSLSTLAGATSRRVAAALIAGVWRKRSVREVDAWIRRRPGRDQVMITGGVLAALLALSVVAAQFGWVGMLVFWLLVIVIVN